MDMVNQVQILEKVVYVSHCTNTLQKDMNPAKSK